jgi:DNA-binding transcriptional ArsR family regulator
MRTLYHPAREEIELTNIFYALSDPLRLQVFLQLMMTEGEISCGDVVVGRGAKSTQSHHFKVLRESGLTRTRPQGTRLMIQLRREDLEARFPGLLTSIVQVASSSRAQVTEPV